MGADPELQLTVDELIERERACGVLYGPFWRARYLERAAPERVRRELLLAGRYPEVRGFRSMREAPLLLENPSASSAAVTAAAETNLWTAAVLTPIPAGDAAPGSVYHVCFGGIYSNRTTSSPTSLWTARWGQSSTPASNVTLGASAGVYSGAALTNNPLYGEFTFAVQATGVTGAGVGAGVVIRGTGASGVGTIRQTLGGTVATIDTTIAGGLIVSHTWSAANASNTLTVQWVVLRALN